MLAEKQNNKMIFMRVLFACVFLSMTVSVQAASEADVKAAFLFQFANLVTWPSSAFSGADAPFIIGVLGDTPVASSLEAAVSGKSVKGRKISVQRYRRLSDITSSHILFVSDSEKDKYSKIFSSVSGKPILTVGEGVDFCKGGGVIAFTEENKKIGLALNSSAADKAGLGIDSKLSGVCKKV